jgi:elongation factor 1-alpha
MSVKLGGNGKKKYTSCAIIGNLNSGKSTLAGHLLHQLGVVNNHCIQENIARVGPLLKFANVMFQHEIERQNGMTIDNSLRSFTTHDYEYTLIDTPGRRKFMKTMITGMNQADNAVLVLDAIDDSFLDDESWCYKDINERCLLAYCFGIKQILVAVNKMDCLEYSQRQYDAICAQATSMLTKLGFAQNRYRFVPVAALDGTNITQGTTRELAWYSGPTLLDALNGVVVPSREKQLARPFRMAVRKIHRIRRVGVVLTGRVYTGAAPTTRESVICAAPTGLTVICGSVHRNHATTGCDMGAGTNIAIHMRACSVRDFRPGDVLSSNLRPDVVAFARPCLSFHARIMIVSHPTKIRPGYTASLHFHLARVPARVSHILEKSQRSTGAMQTPADLEYAKQGDIVVVRIEPMQPVVVELFAEYGALGRIALRDGHNTVAVGIVIIVEHGVCDIRRRPINVRERTGPRPKKERRLFAAGDRPVVQRRGKGAKE